MSRTRRGPRFGGTHLCAAIAALLLLFSVSVLHSRLGPTSSASRSPSLRLGLGLQNPTPQTTIPTLESKPRRDLADDADKDASDDSGTGDDRIDELDNLDEEIDAAAASRVSERAVVDEEEILRGAGIEDDDDDDDSDFRGGSAMEKRNSGLFWDHVTGVMRRAFDKRSGAVDDLLDGMNLNLEEDRSNLVFTSDDQPLDEYLGKKLAEIKTVEDALLLKRGGGGASSLLRDGWAPWFEKKGDFLRKDRMFRSNLEALNPLNNPLLQDPDMPGVTTLTRGDKLLQKKIWKELEKTPFGGAESVRSEAKKITEERTSDGVSKDNADKNHIISKTADARNANPLIHLHKRTGRETLQARKDLGLESKKLNSVHQSNIELKQRIYADGRRWGYFPGLDPHLSFSDFMDQFLGQNECSMQLLMVWNTPPWMYGVRHQRSLESIFYHHQDACVVVFSETIDLDFFSDFVKDGFKIAVVMPNLDELLKDTPTYVFASVWHEWRKIKHYPIHYSELIRLAALYKYGGVYLDFDVIVLKPLRSLKNSIAMEDELTGSSTFNGAVMAFERHSSFIMECLHEFYSTYDDTSIRWNGADLLTRVVKRLVSNHSLEQLGLKIEPPFAFFPISSQDITRYFSAEVDEAERANEDVLFEKILDESYTFHFWNSVTSAFVPEPSSLVERLLNRYCLRCIEVL
ncbi:Alpha 1,4-glycosyltransferase domain-containing protein [Cinnamomum micranthum f. kanehirae]|uniref:Alpha 1,4-glycosyltransferase domain-containing protein n=1 Tax=Cinnamomum micranthum f. kanehirae TaxID=337451 RepID=A0A443NTU5_9MAGN|nr:Alpha 1,4-glycosyltransferase domain-containing protein [Cinnamomum micranthum f. kanehirae]